MTKQDFIKELMDIMELDVLDADQKLAELEEFDSLAIMSIVALAFSRFKVKLSGQEIKNAKTPEALIALIGESRFN